MTGRTIIKTETPGWFIDPTNGDKKVRKQEGDNILTRTEYDKALSDDTTPVDSSPKATTERMKAAIKADKPEVQTTILSSGKAVTGKTTTIKCAWVDPDNRTDEQVKLFDKGDPKVLTFDAVKKAAGTSRKAQPDGTERIIKVQDAFQVRFCIENQSKWHAELRRRKARIRREKARKAAKA